MEARPRSSDPPRRRREQSNHTSPCMTGPCFALIDLTSTPPRREWCLQRYVGKLSCRRWLTARAHHSIRALTRAAMARDNDAVHTLTASVVATGVMMWEGPTAHDVG